MDNIPTKCITPNFCLPGLPLESLCLSCQVRIEEAAIQSALNMGIPEHYYCGFCGRKLSKNKLIEHLTENQNGECLDADS